MSSKKILYAGIAILVLGIGFAVGTYAYYQNTVTGSVSGTVLYWDCTKNVTNETTVLNGLYPGSTGSITFVLNCSMDADYSIYITGLTNMGTGDSKHPNLNLYKTSSYTTANVISASSTTAAVTGTLTGGTAKNQVIYFNWPYGTSAETYASDAPSFTYSITFKQKQ